MEKWILALLSGLLLIGCTSVTVTPLEASYAVKHICIRENPKVTVEDFLPVLADGLTRHHIENEIIPASMTKEMVKNDYTKSDRYFMNITQAPDHCEFSLIYSARRSWDLGTYLSTALIEILKDNAVIASADYHLINKGGLSLFKWQGVKTKIDPVMDELLQHY